MAEIRTQRRLAAILAADVAGYSRMMQSDEAGTLAALREIWATRFNPAVAEHQGRIVKMIGDGALVEFASAVDAVECAIAIQGAMANHNALRAGQAPIEFRIGINLGDIVIEGDDIFGDGVNVAARLEARAPLNGVLLSDVVHGQIKGKVGADFTDAGDFGLKNIAVPVRAWRWTGAALPAAAPAAKAGEASPSIAVLPFINMSGDPEQEYFSDGITEDIITDLSKISGLMVIARNSSFAYKGKHADIRTVGRELGVSSVLEGSIRRAANRVRITAQLIDAGTGGHLWAERYDRDLTDIFALQDEVTRQIVEALKLKLRPAEKALLAEDDTSNFEAHDCFLRGRALLYDLQRSPKDAAEVFDRAVAAFDRAIELDPAYAKPHAGLALAYNYQHQNHYRTLSDPLGLAVRFSARAIDLGPGDTFAHFAAAVVSTASGDVAAAISASEKALAIDPNFAPALQSRGVGEMTSGTPLAAIPYFDRAMRLDPASRQQILHFLGTAYLLAGKYETAAITFRERIVLVPNTEFSRAFLASALGHLGEVAEARRIWRELRAINPRYSFEQHLGRFHFRNPAQIREGLAKAGLPD